MSIMLKRYEHVSLSLKESCNLSTVYIDIGTAPYVAFFVCYDQRNERFKSYSVACANVGQHVSFYILTFFSVCTNNVVIYHLAYCIPG